MAKTVLAIAQSVCKLTGTPPPSILISSNDDQIIQMTELLNTVGQDLITRFKFQEQLRRTTFVSVAAESQGNINVLLGAKPEMIEYCTLWDDTEQRPIGGSVDNVSYQMYKASVPAGTINEYRIMNDLLLINPIMPAGHTISVLYRVKAWLINGSTYKEEVSDDADEPILDDVMIKLGLVARWKEEKGLPYAEDSRRYETMAIGKAAKSGTKPVLYLDDCGRDMRPGIWVPAGNTVPL